MRLVTALALTTFAFAAPAFADDVDVLNGKVERLEREINTLQKQVYRAGKTSDGAPIASGNTEVRLTQMSEEMRQLRGQLEQIQFANRQLATDLKKLNDDADYRLRALEQNASAAAAAAAAAPVATAAPVAVPAEPAPAKFEPEKKAEAKPALTGNDFPDANSHYSHAFKLLNEKKYPEAASSFDAFVKKYPTDPLTANAYYWLGESYYARGDYTRSAESFRKGFETNPEGQKAPDNLFKLAKSLNQVKRTNEACIVLGQVSKKYSDTAPRIAKRAEEEVATMQCK